MSEIFSPRTNCEPTSAKRRSAQICACTFKLPENIRKCLEQWIVSWRFRLSWNVNSPALSLTSFSLWLKREGGRGRRKEQGRLMEISHQAVAFLCVMVSPLCFLGHAVLISICNFNLRKHFYSFQRDPDTHLSCFAIENWQLFGGGSSRTISFDRPPPPPTFPCVISVGLFWERCQCFMLPMVIVRFLCSYKL